MTYADSLILDESRVGLFQPGLPNLTSYCGCSTLAGPNIELYAMGCSTRTVEVEHRKALKPQPTADLDAQKRACDAAGGRLDQGDGWILLKAHDGYRHRRATPRDPLLYRAARQDAHDKAWLASGPHLCAHCGVDMPPGHYGRDKRFCPGHGAQPRKGRQPGSMTVEQVTAKRQLYNAQRRDARAAERARASGLLPSASASGQLSGEAQG
jgi:hypothetical protein